MSERLKPFSIGEILDRTATIYRQSFLRFAVISALPSLMSIGMSVAWLTFVETTGRQQVTPEKGALAGLIFLFGVMIFLSLFLATESLSMGGLTVATVRQHDGERLSTIGALKAAWKRGWSYVGTLVLQWLFVGILPYIVLAFVVVIGAMLAAVAGAAVGVLLGILLVALIVAFMVYMVLAWIRVSLNIPACAAEGLNPWRATVRSFKLTRNSKGRIVIFGLLFVALNMAVTMVLVMVLMVPFFAIVFATKSGASFEQQTSLQVGFFVVYYVALFFAQTLTKPVYVIGLTEIYFDERVRQEGYDIERLMASAGLMVGEVGGGVAAASGAVPPPIAGPQTWFEETSFGGQLTKAVDVSKPEDKVEGKAGA